MDNLIFSLNATMPVFLVIVIGYLLRKIGIIGEEFVASANKINFKVTLPALLFLDMLATDFTGDIDYAYVLFCAVATIISFFLCWILTKKFLKDKSIVGEFVQASYRSSAAVMGTAFLLNMYGNTGKAAFMIIGAVPLYNIFAVTVLTVESPGNIEGKGKIAKTAKGILTNPIIISIIAGILLSLLKVKLPTMVNSTIKSFANMSTPIALIAIGGGFEIGKSLKMAKEAFGASFIKLCLWPLIFIPIAVKMGYRGDALMPIVVMLGSPSTPSCYVMAISMKSKGVLSSAVIVLTTLLSAFTITLTVYILKSMGYL